MRNLLLDFERHLVRCGGRYLRIAEKDVQAFRPSMILELGEWKSTIGEVKRRNSRTSYVRSKRCIE
jgi:hypothetical protein